MWSVDQLADYIGADEQLRHPEVALAEEQVAVAHRAPRSHSVRHWLGGRHRTAAEDPAHRS